MPNIPQVFSSTLYTTPTSCQTQVFSSTLYTTPKSCQTQVFSSTLYTTPKSCQTQVFSSTLYTTPKSCQTQVFSSTLYTTPTSCQIYHRSFLQHYIRHLSHSKYTTGLFFNIIYDTYVMPNIPQVFSSTLYTTPKSCQIYHRSFLQHYIRHLSHAKYTTGLFFNIIYDT